MSATVLKCPSCHHPLSAHVHVIADCKVVSLFCGFGPCKPAELGTGVPAQTAWESYQGLQEMYRQWLEAQPE